MLTSKNISRVFYGVRKDLMRRDYFVTNIEYCTSSPLTAGNNIMWYDVFYNPVSLDAIRIAIIKRSEDESYRIAISKDGIVLWTSSKDISEDDLHTSIISEINSYLLDPISFTTTTTSSQTTLSKSSFKPYQVIISGRIGIEKVIYNNPATIIIWSSGEKTVVKCSENDEWDPEKGFVMAFLKHILGGKTQLHRILKKYVKPQEDLEDGLQLTCMIQKGWEASVLEGLKKWANSFNVGENPKETWDEAAGCVDENKKEK